MNWDMIAAISSAVASITVVVGILIALIQLREITKSRSLDSVIKIHEVLSSEQARKDRWYIYNCNSTNPEKFSEQDREVFGRVAVSLDTVSSIMNSGLAPNEVVFMSHGEVFVKIWKSVLPFVTYVRQTISPTYVVNFEAIANQAEQNLRKRYPNIEFDPKPWPGNSHNKVATLAGGTG